MDHLSISQESYSQHPIGRILNSGTPTLTSLPPEQQSNLVKAKLDDNLKKGLITPELFQKALSQLDQASLLLGVVRGEGETYTSLEKGKRAVIGEVRVWSGEKFVRTKDGWKYMGKDKGTSKEPGAGEKETKETGGREQGSNKSKVPSYAKEYEKNYQGRKETGPETEGLKNMRELATKLEGMGLRNIEYSGIGIKSYTIPAGRSDDYYQKLNKFLDENNLVRPDAGHHREDEGPKLNSQEKAALEAISLADSSIKNFDGITVQSTPKGNWEVFKDGKKLTTLNRNMISEEMIDKHGLQHFDDGDEKDGMISTLTSNGYSESDAEDIVDEYLAGGVKVPKKAKELLDGKAPQSGEGKGEKRDQVSKKEKIKEQAKLLFSYLQTQEDTDGIKISHVEKFLKESDKSNPHLNLYSKVISSKEGLHSLSRDFFDWFDN